MRTAIGRRTAALSFVGAMALVLTSVVPEPADAQALRRPGGNREAAKPQTAAGPVLDRKRGAAEAPAVVTASGAPCTVADAAYLGTSNAQVNGAAVTRNAYEVACSEGLGFLIVAPQGAGATAPTALDCVTAQTNVKNEVAAGRPAGVQCRLPANARPAAGLQPLLRQAGATCTVTDAAALGRLTGSGMIRYEVACSEGPGYTLDRPEKVGAAPVAQTCFRAEQTTAQFRCTLTTKAVNLGVLTPVVTASKRACTVADARLVGRNPESKNEVLEVGCSGTPGFFIETAANGGFVQAYDCGRFGNTPCQYTAAAAVQQRNAEDYSRLLRAANFDCAVSNFNRLGSEEGTGREIVEVACSNRPDGAFALLSTGSGPSEVYDCLLAMKRKEMCRLTSEEALYPRLSAGMAAQKTRCTPAMTRRMGTTPQGEDWYEIACSEGRNYVVDYRGGGQVRQALTCDKGSRVLGGCKLPTTGGSTRR